MRVLLLAVLLGAAAVDARPCSWWCRYLDCFCKPCVDDSTPDYLEETEACCKCDDEINNLKAIITEVIANQSRLIFNLEQGLVNVLSQLDRVDQSEVIANQSRLILNLEQGLVNVRSQLGTLVARVDHMDNNNDTDTNKPQDCQDILDNDETMPSGVYMVYPQDNLGGFLVFCDMDTDGGGWTLFQKRQDGTVDVYRDWTEYKTGFPSSLNGEFWLGNDNLYRLAVQKVYQLRVDMEDVEGNTAYAAYDSFAISPESQNYQLHLGTYNGSAGDSMAQHNGKPFSTKDRDNDDWPKSCAQTYKGGWWYVACHGSNLNGLYLLGSEDGSVVSWSTWKGHYYCLKRTEMKIRPT